MSRRTRPAESRSNSNMVPVRDTNKEINAADIEHVSALAVGGLMLFRGYRTPGVLGALYKVAGLGMLYRGQKGYRRLYQACGLCLAETPTGVGRWNARVESQIVIDRSRGELYRIWRNLSTLPVFMQHLIAKINAAAGYLFQRFDQFLLSYIL